MAFYDLPKTDRDQLVAQIDHDLLSDLQSGSDKLVLAYFADSDTYIRKTAYLAIGKMYSAIAVSRPLLIQKLESLLTSAIDAVRQTVINAAGEVGKTDFDKVVHFFDTGLFDPHHSVRNAVIGSMKKMGEKNPEPVLQWSRKYLHHSDKEIRREICHGIELRGRTHPQDILPLLKELQFDKTRRVRWTLVHVIGQISYKKNCLETVMKEITTWENKQLVDDAITEIIDVHDRYKNFSFYTQAEAKMYISTMLENG